MSSANVCPKCATLISEAAVECPNCGVLLAKVKAPSTAEPWFVLVEGKRYPADPGSLRAWVDEGRLALDCQVLRPGDEWRQLSAYPELITTISTGDIAGTYETIDAVFAFEGHSTGTFFGGGSGDPNLAFTGVKSQLRKICRSLGGDAVINCQFQYRVAIGEGLLAKNQTIEIFAYGTVVRIVDRSSG